MTAPLLTKLRDLDAAATSALYDAVRWDAEDEIKDLVYRHRAVILRVAECAEAVVDLGLDRFSLVDVELMTAVREMREVGL